MMRLLCGQRDYHKDVLSLCDLHPTLVGIVLLCFCLAQAAFAQSRAHGKEYKKTIACRCFIVYSNIYVRRDDRKFCQQKWGCRYTQHLQYWEYRLWFKKRKSHFVDGRSYQRNQGFNSTKPKQVDSANQKSGLNSQILGFWTATWVAPKPYQWELFSRQTCSEFRTSSTGTSWVPTQDSRGLKSGIKCGNP